MKSILKLVLITFLFANPLFAKSSYFQEGIALYKNKNFKKAKFKFEQDIVYNPKNEISYLYLSKIYKNLDKKNLEEQYLNTVILLNPKNEEAILNLAKLKLDSSDYKKSKELNIKLSSLCKKFCKESKKLKNEIENLSKK
jgi:tetratricopeptide (TPR) repeat protein|tara:strand:+ start:1851 stop:2270 length:420 start_codon:yes stop_codon:yes gene_type:complete